MPSSSRRDDHSRHLAGRRRATPLERALGQERVCSAIAQRLLAAGLDDSSFDDAATDALRMAAEFCGADRAFAFLLVPRQGGGYACFRLAHAWDRPGAAGEKMRGAALDVPIERVAWTLARVLDGKPMRTPSRSIGADAKRDRAGDPKVERELLARHGAEAAIGLPIPDRQGIAPFGAVGLASARGGRAWPRAGRDVLGRLAEMLGEALARKRSFAEERKARADADLLAKQRVEFAARVSHEIRTPLNGVIGMADMLLGSGLSAEQRDLAETVRVSGEALLCVVNDVLDYAKLEAGKVELERAPLNLREVFEEVADILRPRAVEADCKLTVALERGMHTRVEGDAARLRQTLLNLADNAVKHARGASVALRASRDRASAERSAAIRFEVIDSGAGIPPEQMDRLFLPYEQLEAATARVSGGTGLGLAIARGIVRAMGGDLKAESEPGKGSRFWFTASFPIVHRTGPTETSRRREHAGGLRVLVAAPTEASREEVLGQLAAWSCDAEQATAGADALEALRAASHAGRPFQLALLDEELASPGAAQVAARAKADAALASTRFLILSRRYDSAVARAYAEHGFAGRLLKPVKQAKLFEAMAKALGFWTASLSGMESTRTRLLERRLAAKRPRGVATLRRVLVVEDNPLNQKVALRLLRDAGLVCEIAENGSEAVERAAREAFDAILMDCQMPVMDGWEATRRIREQETLATPPRRVPIVAMTANALSQDQDRCIEAGMDEYVAKPIRRVTLLAAIERVLATGAGEHDSDYITPPSLPTPSTDPNEPPVDREVLREVSDNDPVFEREMHELFLEDQPPRLEALESAARSGDAHLARAEAHAARGGALNIGARRMARLASKAEAAAAEGDMEMALDMAIALKAEFDRVRAYLADSPESA